MNAGRELMQLTQFQRCFKPIAVLNKLTKHLGNFKVAKLATLHSLDFELWEETRALGHKPCRHGKNIQTRHTKLGGLNPEPSCCNVSNLEIKM